jgi:hypothetical protein
MTEEFNPREAVRGGQTLYMSYGMHKDLKMCVPHRAGLDGAS